MKKTFKSLMALLLTLAMCVSLFAGISVSAEGVTEVIIANEEIGQDISGFCTIPSTEQVKVGSYAYKSTPGQGAAECWMMRGNPGGLNVSAVVENGALRFWVYVEDITTLENWGGSQIQMGAGWDNNVYVWSHWHTQLVNNGWNEVILPFASASKVGTPDATNITWFFIRNGNVSYSTVVYFDNIRATADCVPETTEKVMATAEWSTEIMNTGFCAVPSDEQAAVGKYSYKCSPGHPGSSDFFAIRGNFNSTDVSGITQNGTAGALRFKVYVEDITTLANWNGSQVQFGSNWWDSDVYSWGDFRGQITKNGWNDIILPFASTGTIGNPNISAVSFILIRTGSADYATTIYIDDIRVTPSTADLQDVKLVNEEQGIAPNGTGFCAGISTEQAFAGSYSYKCWGGNPGGSDNWVLRGDLPRAYDLSKLSLDGTSGALKFSVYVEDIASKNTWYNEGNTITIEASLGTEIWNNYFVWDIKDQITESGWNEVVLPLNTARIVGTVSASKISYFWIRVGNVDCDANVYVDEIRFESRKLGDVNADYSINADDVVSVRKALLGIAEADAYADVNNSGNLDIADLIRLKKDIAA